MHFQNIQKPYFLGKQTPFKRETTYVDDNDYLPFDREKRENIVNRNPANPKGIMPDNVEIKARVSDVTELKARAAKLSGGDGELLEQEDTFFACPNGRLKLRILKGSPAELIFYDRPDQAGPKLSQFHKATISDPQDLKQVLTLGLGVRGDVKKRRYLYMVGQTRIHVDHVENLGDFMELEVKLRDGQSPEEGHAIAVDLMQKLGVKEEDLLTCAYMDLLLGEKTA